MEISQEAVFDFDELKSLILATEDFRKKSSAKHKEC